MITGNCVWRWAAALLLGSAMTAHADDATPPDRQSETARPAVRDAADFFKLLGSFESFRPSDDNRHN